METPTSRTTARDAQSPVFEFPDIVVVGSINADLVARVDHHPDPGETVLADASRYCGGGKGANQAVAASLLGARVAMVGAVGSDARADMALLGLREAGVDISRVGVVDAETGLAVVTVDASGENAIVVIPGANAHVTPSDIAGAAERVEYTPIVVAQCELDLAVIEEVVARVEGRFVLNLAPFTPVPEAVLAQADPLIVNETEARGLASHLLGADMSSKTPYALAEVLVPDFAPSIVITESALGCTVKEGDDSPARIGQKHLVQPEQIVDSTGAGDMFVAALCVSLGRSAGLFDACEFANELAAATVVHPGAQPAYFQVRRAREVAEQDANGRDSNGHEVEHPA